MQEIKHDYYHYAGMTDLDKMKDEARTRLKDKRHPEQSMIHMHGSNEACEKHEHIAFVFEEV